MDQERRVFRQESSSFAEVLEYRRSNRDRDESRLLQLGKGFDIVAIFLPPFLSWIIGKFR
jgi:hypothetical protein